jgi:hypothetical protein
VAAEVGRAQDRLPKVPIVVVADCQGLNFVREVISLGVRGYIPTSFDFAAQGRAISLDDPMIPGHLAPPAPPPPARYCMR